MTVPVILAHGIFRFDALSVFLHDHAGVDLGPHYFDGIKDFLNQHGVQAEETNVNFAGSLELRAKNLATEVSRVLEDFRAAKVDIIAHSMGGLDARKMIVDEGMASKVRVVTTIGTPHHGTSAADMALRLGGQLLISGLLHVIDLQGFQDLTTTACRTFNQRVNDAEVANGVRYRAVTASESVERTIPLLQPTWIQIHTVEGESDGIVPTSSQRWTDRLVSKDGTTKAIEQIAFPLPADHLNEVGVWDTGELLAGLDMQTYQDRVREFYLMLAKSAD
ncbi:MAG TPA: hypothetical protein VF219_23255 [Vicinamibacterales bacterium]